MNNWNENTEAVVKKIRDTCRLNRMMHITEANKSKRLYNFLTLSGMLIGPITGILTGTKEIGSDSTHLVNSSVIVLSLMSSFIMSVVKFGNLDEMMHLNKEASSAYHMIENNADLQLLMEVNKRRDASEYIEWLQAKFEDTFDKSPLLNEENYTEEKKTCILSKRVNIEYNDERSSDKPPSMDRVLQYELNRMSRV